MPDQTPDQQTLVDAFNRAHHIGYPVRYWTGDREGDGKISTTRTEAQLLGGHTAVVWVEGVASCIALTHVEPLPDQPLDPKLSQPINPFDVPPHWRDIPGSSPDAYACRRPVYIGDVGYAEPCGNELPCPEHPPVPGSSHARKSPEPADVDIEELSAAVHAGWTESKRSAGITSRLSESGEELMVPYAQLSEAAKELDRGTVRSVLAGIERAGYVVARAGGSQASEPAPSVVAASSPVAAAAGTVVITGVTPQANYYGAYVEALAAVERCRRLHGGVGSMTS